MGDGSYMSIKDRGFYWEGWEPLAGLREETTQTLPAALLRKHWRRVGAGQAPWSSQDTMVAWTRGVTMELVRQGQIPNLLLK